MPHPFEIRRDDLTGDAIAALLQEHLDFVVLHSPPESVHALNLAGLQVPEISFWTIWSDNELVGCGALKELSAEHAELKSMRTATKHQRQGIAQVMLQFLLEEAERRGYRQISLETGSAKAFAPAHALYATFGFIDCGPFGDYVLDPYSVFMTLRLPRVSEQR